MGEAAVNSMQLHGRSEFAAHGLSPILQAFSKPGNKSMLTIMSVSIIYIIIGSAYNLTQYPMLHP